MRSRKAFALPLLVLALVMAGCGGGGSNNDHAAPSTTAPAPTAATPPPAPRRTPAEDRRAAARAVVLASDFPSGWRRDAKGYAGAAARCLGTIDHRAPVASAEAPTFREDESRVTSVAFLYADPEAAAPAARSLRSPSARSCLRTELRRELEASRKDLKVLGMRMSSPAAAASDGRIDALSVEVQAHTEGLDVPVYIDVTMLHEGRGVAFVVTGDAFSPFDTSGREALALTIDRRLAAAVGVPGA